MKGKLELIIGPMFAGKTSALLNKARNFKEEMVLIKPSFDTRYGICEIKTHDGVAAQAFNLSNTDEILRSDNANNAKAVFFDEIQFFTEPYFGGNIIECITTLLDRNINVICCGLDLNWKGEPFEIVAQLKKFADQVYALKSKCAICNEPAIYSHKRSGTGGNIELGAADLYEPRCAKHFPFSPIYLPEEEKTDEITNQGTLFNF